MKIRNINIVVTTERYTRKKKIFQKSTEAIWLHWLMFFKKKKIRYNLCVFHLSVKPTNHGNPNHVNRFQLNIINNLTR